MHVLYRSCTQMSSDRSWGGNEEANKALRCYASSQSKGRCWQETVNQLKTITSDPLPSVTYCPQPNLSDAAWPGYPRHHWGTSLCEARAYTHIHTHTLGLCQRFSNCEAHFLRGARAAICVTIPTPSLSHNSVESEHTDMIHIFIDSA